MEIHLVGVTLLHADRRTDGRKNRKTERQTAEGLMYMTKLTDASRDYANASTNDLMFCGEITSHLNII
jgi:hypothetical protein